MLIKIDDFEDSMPLPLTRAIGQEPAVLLKTSCYWAVVKQTTAAAFAHPSGFRVTAGAAWVDERRMDAAIWPGDTHGTGPTRQPGVFHP